MPDFEIKVIEEFPDGSRHVRNNEGTIILEKDDATSIPKEIEHLLKDRASWEEHYLSKLQFDIERVTRAWVNCDGTMVRFDQGAYDRVAQVAPDHWKESPWIKKVTVEYVAPPTVLYQE